jgi:hypothetical protein
MVRRCFASAVAAHSHHRGRGNLVIARLDELALAMAKRGHGVIINVTIMVAEFGAPEMAAAITYLASGAASFVHGAVLPVDGGRIAV